MPPELLQYSGYRYSRLRILIVREIPFPSQRHNVRCLMCHSGVNSQDHRWSVQCPSNEAACRHATSAK